MNRTVDNRRDRRYVGFCVSHMGIRIDVTNDSEDASERFAYCGSADLHPMSNPRLLPSCRITSHHDKTPSQFAVRRPSFAQAMETNICFTPPRS